MTEATTTLMRAETVRKTTLVILSLIMGCGGGGGGGGSSEGVPPLCSSPAWIFLSAYPHILSVKPASGPIAGGTEVTITGNNFSGATVAIDNILITPIALSDTEVRLQAPAHPSGIALIKIQNTSGAGYGELLYVPPTLNEISSGYITTVAGFGTFFGEGRVATQAMVEPTDVALDNNGNIYIAEPGLARIRRIRTDGIIEMFAGTGIEGSSNDGIAATSARLWQPRGIAVDPIGNLYIADGLNHRVRRVDAATGIITAVAGTGTQGFSGDNGQATNAQLNTPNQVAIDKDGNIFVLDSGSMRIRRIDTNGIITTIAGNGTAGYSGDGAPATSAQFNISFLDNGGLATDPQGNVYLADTDNNVIRKIDMKTGIITTFATAAGVRAVTFDQAGNLYFAINDLGKESQVPPPSDAVRIVKMNSNGQRLQTWGLGRGFSQDCTSASNASLGFIDRVRVDQQGNIFFTDFSSLRLRRINITNGLLETWAGIGPAVTGENGPATAAALNIPNSDLEFLPNGDLLIADGGFHRIWKTKAQGNISAYAGNGIFGFKEEYNVAALDASIIGPVAIALEPSGSLLVANTHVVSRIDNSGIYRHVAGSGWGFSGDGGLASNAQLNRPWDVAVDSAGNIYIADSNNNRIRMVDAKTGIITTVAGSGPTNAFEGYGNGSFCGDNGPAVQACLNTPYGVAVSTSGEIYIADSHNRLIRKVDQSGIITTFADMGAYNSWPTKLVFDSSGNLYVSQGDGVFRINPTGSVTRIVGQSGTGFSGDGGPALQAQMNALGQASGIAIDLQGNLFFTDGFNRRVRVVKFGTF